MTSAERIELALRSAQVAEQVLAMMRVASKTHAQIIITETIVRLKDLNDRVEKLAEDK